MTYGSLFSGIGGFDLAAKWLNWEIKFLAEKNDWCRKILKKHYPGAVMYDDVRDVNEDSGYVDVLSGGFPCVDISNAKNAIEKPKGLQGDESQLWYEYKRILSILRPRYAVVENSSNLNIRGLYAVVGDLTQLRYDCFWFTLPASRVGAPHRRRRTFIVANTNEQGLEGDVCKKLAGEIKRRFDTNVSRSTWWDTEPRLDRVVDGLPYRVHQKRQRLEALGNAVVPQVALPILSSINEINKILINNNKNTIYDRSTE